MDNVKRYITCLICLLAVASCLCIRVRAEGINPDATAKGCILIDAATGRVLYEKNAYSRLPMASTTKIMTTLITAESGDLDKPFEVDPDAIKVEGSSMGLKEGTVVTKRMLLFGMMLPSGNDAANAAALSVAGDIDSFVELMNKKAVELSLNDTHFVTPSGLDDFTSDHYSTAYDMAILTREALKNETFVKICSTRSVSLRSDDGREFYLSNTNRLLDSCDGVIGVKTGFTDKAGRCLVSACKRGEITLICVTLNDPNDWYDHSRLYDYGFSAVETRSIKGVSLRVPLVGGKDDFVRAAGEGFEYSAFSQDFERIEKTILIPRFLYHPAVSGEKIGQTIYSLDGKMIAVKDITIE